MPQGPDLFISYSQESDEHVHAVLTLAQWFRSHGVDAHLDKFEQSPPQGWQLWCYEQVQNASYVVVVCTEAYERRVLRQEKDGVGRGATWEGAIITSEIYDSTSGQSKFIPVVLSPADADYVPFFLKGASLYVLSDQESLLDLYKRVTNQPEYVPAPVGEVMEFPRERLETALPVAPIPPPAARGNQPQQPPTATQQPPVQLTDIIEGEWVIQIQSPVFGAQMMRLRLAEDSPGGRHFEAGAIVGPPGWQANGTWEVLPGEQIALQGVQTVAQPFPQSMPYQTFNQFFSITPDELHGMSATQESVIWRRA